MQNLTPHEIVVFESQDPNSHVKLRCPSVGSVRLTPADVTTRVRQMLGVPILDPPSYNGISGLPPREFPLSGIIIVSTVVAEYLVKDNSWYAGIMVPATGPDHVVRDTEGKIIGTTAFYCYQPPQRQ